MSPAKPPRVLVLEDEWMIADQIETALTGAGFEVVGPVGQIQQALALIAGSSVDAAVLDINLHGERSFDVAQNLTQAGTPFVFLTGYSQTELPQAFQDRPLLTKPVDALGLQRCIAAMISASRPNA